MVRIDDLFIFLSRAISAKDCSKKFSENSVGFVVFHESDYFKKKIEFRENNGIGRVS